MNRFIRKCLAVLFVSTFVLFAMFQMKTKEDVHVAGKKRSWADSKPDKDLKGSVRAGAPFNTDDADSPITGQLIKFENETFDELRVKYPATNKWGRYRPKNGNPSVKLAIIVPFRDREPHLAYLLKTLIPFLVKQRAEFTIFVAEQAGDGVFNRGLILNAGTKEAMKVDNFTCLISHDVDLTPLEDKNIYNCRKDPFHMATLSSKNGFKKKYSSYIGGVLALTPQQFLRLNGYSNLYFGWGGEDDDLGLRMKSAHMKLQRNLPQVGRYYAIPHTRDAGNRDNNKKGVLFKTATRRMKTEGFSSLVYQATWTPEEFFTHILIEYNRNDYEKHETS